MFGFVFLFSVALQQINFKQLKLCVSICDKLGQTKYTIPDCTALCLSMVCVWIYAGTVRLFMMDQHVFDGSATTPEVW